MVDAGLNFGEFHKVRARRRRRMRLLISIAILYVAALSVAWFVFHSPVFKVEIITIDGNERVSDEAIDDILSILFGSRAGIRRTFGPRNMLGWPSEATPDVLKLAPAIRALELKKDYSKRTLYVTVRERMSFGIWCKVREGVRTPCFWFDEEGVVLEPSVAAEGSLIHMVNDYSDLNVSVGRKVLEDRFLEPLVSVLDTVRGIGVGIREVGLYDIALQELNVKTYEGPELYFSLRFPVPHARSAIEKLFKERDPASYEYLDFRVENRIYYK